MKIFILLLFITVSLTAQTSKKPATVKYVDLKKYTGTWYEIAKIPNSFQDQCVKNAMAEYHLDEDGNFIVVNSCFDEDNEIDKVEGVAKVVDKSSNSKLEVSFVSFLGIRPFWGDYWILGLGTDYEYAVIGTPNRKYGWILAREKSLTGDQLKDAFEIFRKNGYDVKDFKMTRQD